MAARVRASQSGLQQVDAARIRKSWNKQEKAWADLALTSVSTLKRFLVGKAIDQAAFEGICRAVGIEDWQSIADFAAVEDRPSEIVAPHLDPSWVERSALTETLLPIFQGPTRILVLTGITGIGKTALAERLVASLQDGKSWCRLNLDDGGITADFESSGAALLRSLGEELTLEDQKDAKNLLNHLLQLLRSQPYRVQIDSLERLLEGNDREGWSEFSDPLWLDLFQQFLAGGKAESQLIVTTQDLPVKLKTLGLRYSTGWYCQVIRGLSEAEQLALFEKREIANDTETQNYLKRIGNLYEGHPLVLKVIAEDLKACGGDVKRYWQQTRFEELEAKRSTKLSRQELQQQLRQWVGVVIERLPENALQLLCLSAVYRRPVPATFWLAMLPECSEAQQQAALNLLKSRALAEEDWEPEAWLGSDGAIPLRQHNLIRSIAYDLLRADVSIWEFAERKAAELWLNSYEPIINTSNLEQVRSQLESFHHFCEIEAWDLANEVIEMNFNVFGGLSFKAENPLLHWLDRCGLYQEELKVLYRIANKLSPCKNSQILWLLGKVLYNLGEYFVALEFCRLSLEENHNDSKQTIKTLETIGDINKVLGYHDISLEAYRRSLDIINAGNYNADDREINLIKQAIQCKIVDFSILELSSDPDDHLLKKQILSSLLLIVEDSDKTPRNESDSNEISEEDECIEKLEKLSNTVKSFNLQSMEVTNLQALESLYRLKNQPCKSIDVLQRLLKIFRTSGRRGDEADTYRRLSVLHQEVESIELAKENCDQALEIAREIGARSIEAEALKLLAELEWEMGSIESAKENCDRALSLAIELGIPLAKDCEALKQKLEEAQNKGDR